jgi:phosphonate transport system substrate-binding protein
MKRVIAIVFILILPLYAKVYTVAVVPQMPTAKIQSDWAPFLHALSEVTGYEFELKHYSKIPDFEEALKRGECDFAFMNPYHQVMAYDWQRYRPLIHDMKPLVGILVVAKNSPIQSVKELNRKTLAFPSPNAFAASLYLRALLEKEERITFTPLYVKTHNNVYRSVALGSVAAGGGVNNTLMRENEQIQSSLRILYTTKKLSTHPFSVHPRVDAKTSKRVSESILKMGQEQRFAEILDAIQIPKPVLADYVKEYEPLKKLQLSSYIDSSE